MKSKPAPSSLAAAGRQLWRDLTKNYQWTVDQIPMIRLLCETLDRIEEARAAIVADGPYQKAAGMIRVHPALKVEKDAKTSLVSLWKALGLDLAELPEKERQRVL